MRSGDSETTYAHSGISRTVIAIIATRPINNGTSGTRCEALRRFASSGKVPTKNSYNYATP